MINYKESDHMSNKNRRDFMKKSTALAVGTSMNLAPEVISAESQSKEVFFSLGNYKMQSVKFL